MRPTATYVARDMVSVSVIRWAQWRALQKRLNQSRCRLGQTML